MALGDGDTWDETTPTDNTFVYQVDNYIIHNYKAVRSRMALEHEWPSSQAATNEAGRHRYITLQATTSLASVIGGTQVGGVFIGTDRNFYFQNETGSALALTRINATTGPEIAFPSLIFLSTSTGIVSISTAAAGTLDYTTVTFFNTHSTASMNAGILGIKLTITDLDNNEGNLEVRFRAVGVTASGGQVIVTHGGQQSATNMRSEETTQHFIPLSVSREFQYAYSITSGTGGTFTIGLTAQGYVRT